MAGPRQADACPAWLIFLVERQVRCEQQSSLLQFSWRICGLGNTKIPKNLINTEIKCSSLSLIKPYKVTQWILCRLLKNLFYYIQIFGEKAKYVCPRTELNSVCHFSFFKGYRELSKVTYDFFSIKRLFKVRYNNFFRIRQPQAAHCFVLILIYSLYEGLIHQRVTRLIKTAWKRCLGQGACTGIPITIFE